jgi:superfamily I DNA/RNA helicase
LTVYFSCNSCAGISFNVSASSFAKNTLATTPAEIEGVVRRLDLDIGTDPTSPAYAADLAKFCAATLRVMDLSLRAFMDRLEYDFDDMIWIPVSAGLRVKQFDRVIVDEGQDLNACQHRLARMARRAGGRIVLVGDDRQAIYAWRGAEAGGIDGFVRDLGARVLRLPVTYRCGQAIVALAKTAVADYEAAPSNAPGRVDSASEAKMVKDAQPGDAVLSRVNAPLVGLCLEFLKAGKRARVVGRDVGRHLLALVSGAEKAGATGVPALAKWVGEWEKAEVERVLAHDPPGDPDPIHDRAECVAALSEGADSIAAVRARIADLFTDDPGRGEVVLSSTHKAKGLEWDTVWMLADTYRSAFGGEEENLWYVAVTRAISRLVMVSTHVEAAPVEAAPVAAEEQVTAAPKKPANPAKRAARPRRTKEFKPSASSPLWAALLAV